MFDSILKGLFLGFSAYAVGKCMDMFISVTSLIEVERNIPILYSLGKKKIKENLLIISPIVYSFVDKYLLDHYTKFIDIKKVVLLLLVHHIGYYVMHKVMHKVSSFKCFHLLHHEFDFYMVPSIGNAVSNEEFLMAYVSPFVIGAYLLKPNEVTFIIPIMIISVFNNVIHCKEFEHIRWSKYLVSPAQHLEHHKIRNKHYSAPLLNLDYFLEK